MSVGDQVSAAMATLPGQGQLRVFGVSAIQADGMPDALHDLGPTGFGHRLDDRSAVLTIGGADLDLDQLVIQQRSVELFQHRIAQAFGADHHDDLQVMGQTAQIAALAVAQWHGIVLLTKAGKGIMATSLCAAGRRATLTQRSDPGDRMPVKKSSSKRWLKEHFDDPYVQRAHREGVRSRATFKLEELLAKDRLLKPGMVVVDLGAAPGGWSELAAKRLKGNGRVIAMDLLEMAPLENVEFLQGDFSDDQVLAQLEQMLDGSRVDLVMSDMAPNLSGVAAVDQARSMLLAELALDFAKSWLSDRGSFLIKLFQGEGFDAYLKDLRQSFSKVVLRKPKASRGRSREIYAVATELK